MGQDAQLTIELGCTALLDTVRIKNLAPDKGTPLFSIEMSHSDTGPWTQLLSGQLETFKVGVSYNLVC